ncbi:glycosyltransferase family 4 protein [Nocardioides cheoyonin]|uniref:glycosyltransferase family 4 protein n=1 Tax=Nocardioides cheoyonin TaxID=3156615 RepID=UPI003CCC604D
MHLIAVSSFVRGSLVAEGFDPRQITVRPNLVWLGQREISRSPKVDRQILFVGRPTEDKGFYLLLAALERLGAKAPRVTVIGDPTTEARRACREKSLAVTFLGLQDHERVASLIAGASAVVVPSVWAEPFGRVVVESLAVGTPVISSDAGGLSEFAGLSPCVVTVPAGEVEPLATALSEISAPSEMLRAACRQRYIERLSPEIWLQGTMDAINAAIRGAI